MSGTVLGNVAGVGGDRGIRHCSQGVKAQLGSRLTQVKVWAVAPTVCHLAQMVCLHSLRCNMDGMRVTIPKQGCEDEVHSFMWRGSKGHGR